MSLPISRRRQQRRRLDWNRRRRRQGLTGLDCVVVAAQPFPDPLQDAGPLGLGHDRRRRNLLRQCGSGAGRFGSSGAASTGTGGRPEARRKREQAPRAAARRVLGGGATSTGGASGGGASGCWRTGAGMATGGGNAGGWVYAAGVSGDELAAGRGSCCRDSFFGANCRADRSGHGNHKGQHACDQQDQRTPLPERRAAVLTTVLPRRLRVVCER